MHLRNLCLVVVLVRGLMCLMVVADLLVVLVGWARGIITAVAVVDLFFSAHLDVLTRFARATLQTRFERGRRRSLCTVLLDG